MATVERRIGIRELKDRLSECVRDVKNGATIVVTKHGRRVARLVPDIGSLDERLAALKSAGAILWSGRRLGRAMPVVPLRRGRQTIADIVSENRE